MTQARALLAAEKATAEKNRTLGYTQPSKDKFADIIARYLKHQKARLTRDLTSGKMASSRRHLVPILWRN